MSQDSQIAESILTGKLLSLASAGATTSLEKFSSWLLAGFGAAFALLLSNIATLKEFISVEDIRTGIYLYLLALALGVVQRWIAVGIYGAALVAKEAGELGKNADESVNFDNILAEIEKASMYPQKWLVQYQFKKVRSGDFAVSGRMQAVMAQLQSYLVLVQGALVIFAIVVMVSGINV